MPRVPLLWPAPLTAGTLGGLDRGLMALDRPTYRALPVYTERTEVERVLATGTWEELMVLSLALGDGWPDWKFAQDVCLSLAEHRDAAIRANACLGLAYVARTQRRLEKHLVKPVLLRELRDQTEFRGRIEDAISDINTFLKWRLAQRPPSSE